MKKSLLQSLLLSALFIGHSAESLQAGGRYFRTHRGESHEKSHKHRKYHKMRKHHGHHRKNRQCHLKAHANRPGHKRACNYEENQGWQEAKRLTLELQNAHFPNTTATNLWESLWDARAKQKGLGSDNDYRSWKDSIEDLKSDLITAITNINREDGEKLKGLFEEKRQIKDEIKTTPLNLKDCNLQANTPYNFCYLWKKLKWSMGITHLNLNSNPEEEALKAKIATHMNKNEDELTLKDGKHYIYGHLKPQMYKIKCKYKDHDEIKKLCERKKELKDIKHKLFPWKRGYKKNWKKCDGRNKKSSCSYKRKKACS